jgi:hypothetical protein
VRTTNAWVVTGGTDGGVMELVGDAMAKQPAEERSVCLGICSWGIVQHHERLEEARPLPRHAPLKLTTVTRHQPSLSPQPRCYQPSPPPALATTNPDRRHPALASPRVRRQLLLFPRVSSRRARRPLLTASRRTVQLLAERYV